MSPDAVSLLEALPDPLAEAGYRRQLCREAFERGRTLGDHEGYERASADLAAAWHAVAEPASRGAGSYEEYESRRWGALGRAHFGDPRPADLTPGEMLARARASWEPMGLPEPRCRRPGRHRGDLGNGPVHPVPGRGAGAATIRPAGTFAHRQAPDAITSLAGIHCQYADVDVTT